MRNWRFTLHIQDPLTPEQSDTLDHLDCFADGRASLVTGPDTAEFWCYSEAETLTQAIADVLVRFEELPGVLVRSVELDEMALEDNGMWTPAVIPPPPPLEDEPAA
ncbi:hypothetical protein [Streptomyces clavuligerus]|uniref:DUF695 domain-containing protein n=1 Tax=Streptomyces clavuligerus TaxID=1901 RepID=B5GNQ6_STRCL|nr:hypothetical protein [Streptomyces clavuligerus]ANW18773.1 hypothetical protein BB341_11305 [Streptomyces clavuligerus]EDY47878.1 hypothetical protein SSCG_00906 [Streptomyces clavuligerus]EFG08548.1 Hypothetical protein SCLAV_3476 [Streptomyces clavuligerus]MBY6303294.1 hypothetical protein [Streptomyces clavuligerus]QPJ94517.1 hypothetical protein GE265_16830 [Streptomyces clavuligerus]